jgi:DNA-binding CsgD family transcriptional regulator
MLLGRDRELEALAGLLGAARAGSGGVLAVVGGAGVGKTSLLDWAAGHAGAMNVLRARGVESESHIPFAGLFDLLRPALPHLGRLPAPQASAIESALALSPGRAYDRFTVGAATLSLLAAHAESAPVGVFVDDAHLLDGSSADALRFALRRLVHDPVAVVVTVREGEPSLLDGADLATFRVGGLDLRATAELLRRDVPGVSMEAAARLHHATGGNPLALIELAREHPAEILVDAPIPAVTSAAEAYLHRVRGLPEPTRTALVFAAANDNDDVSVLTRALARVGLDVDDLVPAEKRGILDLRAGTIEFRHPLTRSAIYGDASPQDRRAAHRALSEAVPESEADRCAWHLALAATGPDERASAALEQAGARARDRSAYDTASHAFERAALMALDDERCARLTYAAAESAWLAGLPQRARSLLGEAARRGATEQLLIDIDHLRGQIALMRGPLDDGRATLLDAGRRAATSDPDGAVVMLAESALGGFYAGDTAGVRVCGEEARALAARATGRSAFFGQITAGMGLVLSADGEGAALIRDAVDSLEASDDLGRDPRLLLWAMIGLTWLREETYSSGRLGERAVTTARSISAVGVLPHLLLLIGTEQAITDRSVLALATFDEAVGLARETGQETILAGALARLAWVEARCAREQACRDHADEALTLARELGAHVFEIWALIALAELELARGDAKSALRRFNEQQTAVEQKGICDVDLSPAPEQVELNLRLGRVNDAIAAAEPFVDAAATKGQPWALARASRCRALLAKDNRFPELFEQALALHARTPDKFETARTQLAYGSRLRRAGQRIRAREQLRAARVGFDKLGAQPWAEFVSTELAATGETARRRDPSTLDQLTPQEFKVSLLVAQGKTNKEAAAELFLSPKTIEYHLRNSYRKLSVRTRKELAEALAAD